MSDITRDHPLLAHPGAVRGEVGALDASSPKPSALRSPLFLISTVLLVLGFVAIGLGWWGVSGRSEVWEQLPFVVSGALGGLGLIGLAVLAYVAHSHAADRRVLQQVIERIDQLELALAGEFDDLAAQQAQQHSSEDAA